MSEWISVIYQLPEINKDILVCDRDGNIYISHRTPYNNFFTDLGNEIRGIIAWMPLPEPYKAESEDCRDCKKWEDCPCGKEGHESETSQGYSIGECKDFEPQKRKDKEVEHDNRTS